MLAVRAPNRSASCANSVTSASSVTGRLRKPGMSLMRGASSGHSMGTFAKSALALLRRWLIDNKAAAVSLRVIVDEILGGVTVMV